jgi:hypothetical protein
VDVTIPRREIDDDDDDGRETRSSSLIRTTSSQSSEMEDSERDGTMEEDAEAGGDPRRRTLASPAVSAVVTMTLVCLFRCSLKSEQPINLEQCGDLSNNLHLLVGPWTTSPVGSAVLFVYDCINVTMFVSYRNDHTTVTAPLPVCSAKLSTVGPG